MIEGEISSVSDPKSTLDPSVAVGARFSGIVSYELPGQAWISTPTLRQEHFRAPPASISVSVGLFAAYSGPPSRQPLQVHVANGDFGFGCALPCDEVTFGISGPSSTGPPVRALLFSFSDASSQALSDLSIPISPLDLRVLPGTLLISGSPVLGPDFRVRGTVDSMIHIPEPDSFHLLAAALAGLFGLRRIRAAA
jgi:hypothetical protein